jgi:hypothetical protein
MKDGFERVVVGGNGDYIDMLDGRPLKHGEKVDLLFSDGTIVNNVTVTIYSGTSRHMSITSEAYCRVPCYGGSLYVNLSSSDIWLRRVPFKMKQLTEDDVNSIIKEHGSCVMGDKK